MAKEAKVVLIIVEGPSDETALSVLEKSLSTQQVKFFVIHGDITTRKGITAGTIRGDMKNYLDYYLSCSKLKESDILQIIHIVDMDGAYASDDVIEFNENTDHPLYFINKIETNNVNKLKETHCQKKSVLDKLVSTMYIDKTVPYSIYYFSCNLEHVFHDRLEDFSDDEKEDLANEVDDRYHDDLEGFINFLKNSSFSVQQDYTSSWKFIKQGLNSLNRYSNVHLIFDKIRDTTN